MMTQGARNQNRIAAKQNENRRRKRNRTESNCTKHHVKAEIETRKRRGIETNYNQSEFKIEVTYNRSGIDIQIKSNRIKIWAIRMESDPHRCRTRRRSKIEIAMEIKPNRNPNPNPNPDRIESNLAKLRSKPQCEIE